MLNSPRMAVLATLAILGACFSGYDTETGAAPPGLAERDSGGVAISATPAKHADAMLDWQVSSTPDCTLGVADDEPSGNTSRVFYRIGGLRQLSDGHIVVLDGASRELRFFDTHGRLVRHFGRTGDGPGEFRAEPSLVSGFASDSLLVFDLWLGRFHVLSSDGDGYRTITPTNWLWGSQALGIVGSRVFVRREIITKPPASGAIERPVTYAWIDIVTGDRNIVDSVTIRPQYALVGQDGLTTAHRIPFSPVPAAAVRRDRALVSDGASYAIKEYDVDGRLRRIYRTDALPTRVTNKHIRQYAETRTVPLDRRIPIPEVLPSFQSLLVDSEGLVWALVYQIDPTLPSTWIVFGTNGRALGSVTTPSGLDVRQVGRDFILGTWKDTLGVEYVRRHRLNRRTVNDARS